MLWVCYVPGTVLGAVDKNINETLSSKCLKKVLDSYTIVMIRQSLVNVT